MVWKFWQFCLCLLLQLSVKTSGQKTFLDSPTNLLLLRTIRNFLLDFVGRTGTEDGRYIQMARKSERAQKVFFDDVPFPCNVTDGRSPEIPDSVHKLKPGDIDVIGAMGDSLTAGAGAFAHNLFHLAVENRGVTAAGGGQGTWKQYLTIPNILKEFNHNLIGYATEDSLTSHEAAQLNVAESIGMSQDLPYMAEVLVQRIKRHPKINVEKNWKFISIMMGANNFCSEICWIPSPWSILDNHKADLIQALRTLRDNLPRTFVALIPPPHLKALIDSRKGRSDLICDVTTDYECSCMFGFRYRKYRSEYFDIMTRWQLLDMEIATYSEFQRNDFAVVLQPVTMNISLPIASDGFTDMTYLSTDCFHITQKGNALYANYLWNNLLEPVGAKTYGLGGLFEKFLCPTSERPYLATIMNSKK